MFPRTNLLFIVFVIVTLVCLGGSHSFCAAEDATIDDGFVTIDLRAKCNMGFRDEVAGDKRGGWMDQGAKDLRELPTGRKTFGDIPFDIIDPAKNDGRSCVMLQGQARPFFPKAVKNIPVNRKLTALHFLHSGGWLHPTGWAPAYRYVLHYDDGSTAGKDIGPDQVGDWTMPRDLSDATVAWTGTTSTGEQVGVWLLTWENPHPQKTIRSIDLVSDGQAGPLGVIAITGSTRTGSPNAAAERKRTVEGLLSLERQWFYNGQAICGALRLKNFTDRSVNGLAVVTVSVGGRTVARQELPLRHGAIEADETLDLPFAMDSSLDVGRYDITVTFEPTREPKTPRVLDRTRLVSMGHPPAEPLTAENFTRYSEPLFTMIGYVKGDEQLQRDLADMKRRGFDIVCLEWFWAMLEPKRGEYDMQYLRRVIDMAKQADLKYWMYVGFWQLNPDWTAKAVNHEGKELQDFDVWDPETRKTLVELYEQIAKTCKDNDTVLGYTIRLYQPGWSEYSIPARIAWGKFLAERGYQTREQILALYGGVPEKQVFDEQGRAIVPSPEISEDPKSAKVWHAYLQFKKSAVTGMMEELCQAIRKQDPVKPIRLNLAQSYEPDNHECPGWDQIATYTLAAKYGGVVNQECFEFPYHASKEPPLGEKYGVAKTTEGGAVPIGPAGSAALMAHVIETDVAYVAYCHYDVHRDSFQWLQYKPFWKIRKGYRRVYDNLTLTSFWKDSWVGKTHWPDFWQYHFMFNLALISNSYEYDMINEDLLARGQVRKDSVLLDTNSFYLEKDVCENITEYIRNGGVFVGDYLTGVNTFDHGEEYALYRKYFNINITQSTMRGSVKFGTLVIHDQPGFAIKPGKDDVVLARWSDGQAAAVKHRLGLGYAYVFGFPIQSAMDKVMSLVGVTRQLITNATESGLAKNEKGEYFITLLNSHPETREIQVQLKGLLPNEEYRVRDLVRQQDQVQRTDSHGRLQFTTPLEGTKCGFLTVHPCSLKN